MILLCHPQNEARVRRQLLAKLAEAAPVRGGGSLWILPYNHLAGMSIEVRTSPYLEIDQPTGRYLVPGGDAVPADRLEIKTRFVTYGPEDIHWLIYAGLIREEREPVVYCLQEPTYDWRVKL